MRPFSRHPAWRAAPACDLWWHSQGGGTRNAVAVSDWNSVFNTHGCGTTPIANTNGAGAFGLSIRALVEVTVRAALSDSGFSPIDSSEQKQKKQKYDGENDNLKHALVNAIVLPFVTGWFDDVRVRHYVQRLFVVRAIFRSVAPTGLVVG